MRYFLVAVIAAFGLPQTRGAPVEWPAAGGGNGHYYELVEPSGGITWTAAKDAAKHETWLGTPGHLATVTSAGEWNFVSANFPHDYTWIGLTDAVQEGQFRWVTDEPFSFVAWLPNEPNNAGAGAGEDWVHYSYSGTAGRWGWNDFRDEATVYGIPSAYLIEYSVPEPSVCTLLATGAVAAVGVWRRRRTRSGRPPVLGRGSCG